MHTMYSAALSVYENIVVQANDTNQHSGGHRRVTCDATDCGHNEGNVKKQCLIT